jgi:hypothetical protein
MTGPFDDMLADETEDGDKLRQKVVASLDQTERNSFEYLWPYTARKNQLPPEGDWRIWMIMAGRGFGKTRSGAEWVRMIADADPKARIALVSASLAEARAVMVEGESGLLAICRPGHKPIFEPSLHRIRFASGAQAQLFSAAEPESLRGPQHSHACRAGAEGILRQPGAVPARCAALAGGACITRHAARRSRRRREFPSHGPCRRGMERAGESGRGVDRRGLALRQPGRGDAIVRPDRRPPAAVPHAVAPVHCARCTIGGHDRRSGSQGRDCRADAGADDSWRVPSRHPLKRPNG